MEFREFLRIIPGVHSEDQPISLSFSRPLSFSPCFCTSAGGGKISSFFYKISDFLSFFPLVFAHFSTREEKTQGYGLIGIIAAGFFIKNIESGCKHLVVFFDTKLFYSCRRSRRCSLISILTRCHQCNTQKYFQRV